MMSEQRTRQLLLELAHDFAPGELDGWPAIRARLVAERLPNAAATPASAPTPPVASAPAPGRGVSRKRTTARATLRRLAAAVTLLLLCAIVVAALAVVVPGLRWRSVLLHGTPAGIPAPRLVYGYGSPDPSDAGGLSSVVWPTGQVLGHIHASGTNLGGAWALAPDGQRAYLVDREGNAGGAWQLIELAAPTMQVLRRVNLPAGSDIGGYGQLVAVSADGSQVYVALRQVFNPPRDPKRVAQYGHDADYPIAVYDVRQGQFVRLISLGGIECGLASLFALPDGDLLALCGLSGTLHLLDPNAGTQLWMLGAGGFAGVPSPDGRHFWVLSTPGSLQELDLATRQVTRTTDITSTTEDLTAIGPPRLAAGGARLFILAAPRPQAHTYGSGTTVWIVDTTTLTRIGTVSLPAPAADITPLPDGSALLVDALVRAAAGTPASQARQALMVVDVATGRERWRWAGPLGQLVVR